MPGQAFFTKRVFCWGLVFCLSTQLSFGQILPAPGTIVAPSIAHTPLLIKGLKIYPENPLVFDFVVDTGSQKSPIQPVPAELSIEAQKLIKYFLASLTIKESDLWVNLSPYEKDRMMTDELQATELGRDMAAQDYILKQLTASLIYPEKELGRAFWEKVHAKAQERFGTTDIPVETFNKVWIVADKAKVLERDNAAYVIGAHLKVMLESDYIALEKSAVNGQQSAEDIPETIEKSPLTADSLTADQQDLSKQILREIIVPAIETEVNQGQNFAPLRQMLYSMVLASWYKLALKDALLNQVYSNKGKIEGIGLMDEEEGKRQEERGQREESSLLTPERIYEQYLAAYKKGVFNYIKEESNCEQGASFQCTNIPRKYFSGGLELIKDPAQTIERVSGLTLEEYQNFQTGHMVELRVDMKRLGRPVLDAAMFNKQGFEDDPAVTTEALMTMPVIQFLQTDLSLFDDARWVMRWFERLLRTLHDEHSDEDLFEWQMLGMYVHAARYLAVHLPPYDFIRLVDQIIDIALKEQVGSNAFARALSFLQEYTERDATDNPDLIKKIQGFSREQHGLKEASLIFLSKNAYAFSSVRNGNERTLNAVQGMKRMADVVLNDLRVRRDSFAGDWLVVNDHLQKLTMELLRLNTPWIAHAPSSLLIDYITIYELVHGEKISPQTAFDRLQRLAEQNYRSQTDLAMAKSELPSLKGIEDDNLTADLKGGIDFNVANLQMDIAKDTPVATYNKPGAANYFSPDVFWGFEPVILAVTPIDNPLSVLKPVAF